MDTTNEIKKGANDLLTIFEKIEVLDVKATFTPFYNGQLTGIKIIFDCILTNRAIKYIFDICESKNLNLRLIVSDNKFNLLIFKYIK